ncbi:MAG: FMN-binding glutamate synthase family protein [Gammaproteobacteria bacterium]|nr:FMN-binding glutamate synthase family protein [Gammaproteobacteria bacterium]
MTQGNLSIVLLDILEVMAVVFIFVVGLMLLAIIVVYLLDVTQTRHAIRRNYPVIGRLRNIFERLGEFFRQYFFAMDREELPFNRAQRNWVYRAAKNLGNTAAFGSTRNIYHPGSISFVNCPFPTLDEDAVPLHDITLGPYCREPYIAHSVVNISGMSYGAISRPAVLALSRGAWLAGCWLNTGEGGISPWHLEGGADLVFQIGTAKYGVRDEAGRLDEAGLKQVAELQQVKMFEIKLSQGAKPGKGGILPGVKVTAEIAAIRGIAAGKDSISPNRHHEINSVTELLNMVIHIRDLTGKPTGFKLVLGAYGWLDQLCAEINKRGIEQAPDFITLDGADGGSGAAPMSLMDDVGLSLRESLPRLIDVLTAAGLRDRIKVIASGKLITPTDVAWALCVGADFIVTARGFMFALGCIQALQCNLNTCPTGITTHDPRLQKGLDPTDKAERVRHYAENLVHEVCVIAHSCGVKEPRELRRYHARIMQQDGLSVSLEEFYAGRI